jgi:hypothetical protein
MTTSFKTPEPLQTAVLFLVFNRPDTTAQVFEAIRQAKPPRLYVAADGPRRNREGESERVSKVREIATSVDWPCEVRTLFREENLGCKYAVSGGVTWFFEQEEQGIILEDDCLPSQSFFWFCEDLLTKYKENSNIWHVSGATLFDNTESDYTYHFSAYPGIWGWATWSNRWAFYDLNLSNYDKNDVIKKISKAYNISINYWSSLLLKIKKREIDAWSYHWLFSIWYNNGLSITPNVNMISNIGFSADATHTQDISSNLSNVPKKDIVGMRHPVEIAIEKKIDAYLKNKYFSKKSFIKRVVLRFLKK